MFELRKIDNKKDHVVIFRNNNVQFVVHEMLSFISNDTNGDYIIIEYDDVIGKRHLYITNEIKYDKLANAIISTEPINIHYNKPITDILTKLRHQFSLLTPCALQSQQNPKVQKPPQKSQNSLDTKPDTKPEQKISQSDEKLIEQINAYKSDKLYYLKIKNNEIPEVSEIFKQKFEIFELLHESNLISMSQIPDEKIIEEFLEYQQIYDELYPKVQKKSSITAMFDEPDPFMKSKST